MATTKSGIETPTDPPKQSLAAPTKVYPGSKSIGQGADKSGKGGSTIEGPMDGGGIK